MNLEGLDGKGIPDGGWCKNGGRNEKKKKEKKKERVRYFLKPKDN